MRVPNNVSTIRGVLTRRMNEFKIDPVISGYPYYQIVHGVSQGVPVSPDEREAMRNMKIDYVVTPQLIDVCGVQLTLTGTNIVTHIAVPSRNWGLNIYSGCLVPTDPRVVLELKERVRNIIKAKLPVASHRKNMILALDKLPSCIALGYVLKYADWLAVNECDVMPIVEEYDFAKHILQYDLVRPNTVMYQSCSLFAYSCKFRSWPDTIIIYPLDIEIRITYSGSYVMYHRQTEK